MLQNKSFLHKILIILVTITLIGIPLTSVSAATGDRLDCKQWYTVKYGDTLKAVGKKYDTSWRTIATLNNLGEPYTLYTGQKLCLVGKLIPAPVTGSNPAASVRVFAVKVIEDKNVQLQGVRLRPGTPYVVYMSKYNSPIPVLIRLGVIKTDSRGEFNQTFQIPFKLRDVAKIRIQLDNGWNDRTENWFINATSQGNTGGYGAPGLRISVISVVKDTSLEVKFRNVPANVTYQVYIGRPGSRIDQMVRVGQFRSSKAGTFTAGFSIPSKFNQLARLEMRLYNKPLDMGAAAQFDNQTR